MTLGKPQPLTAAFPSWQVNYLAQHWIIFLGIEVILFLDKSRNCIDFGPGKIGQKVINVPTRRVKALYD
jgi:hypothetical protein